MEVAKTKRGSTVDVDPKILAAMHSPLVMAFNRSQSAPRRDRDDTSCKNKMLRSRLANLPTPESFSVDVTKLSAVRRITDSNILDFPVELTPEMNKDKVSSDLTLLQWTNT